jgi:hypothetical protein
MAAHLAATGQQDRLAALVLLVTVLDLIWNYWVNNYPAPAELGGGGLRPIIDAPGTYVFDTAFA